MAFKTSPITPSVLAWALRQDGRPLDAIAVEVKAEPGTLESWVAGEAQPRVGQVSALAETLGRPRVFFFLPRPPETGAIPDAFRRPPGGGNTLVPASVLKEARRAKRIQLAVASTIEDAQRPDLPLARVTDSPSNAAGRARSWLRLGPSPKWADDYDALRWWRRTLDEAGVLVFNLQLGKDQVRGFAASDDRAPMIVMNSAGVSAAARIYTIGHELGHLLLREATACLEPPGSALSVDTRAERWCEQFAGAFLMPANEVRALMRDLKVVPGEADIDAVKAIMRTFRTSARASAVRLIDLNYAQDGLYPAVMAIFRRGPQTSSSTVHSPKRHVMRRRQYGDTTLSTLFEQLTPSDALSVLRMDVEDVRAMADEVPGVPAL